jgi:hypothetical protein
MILPLSASDVTSRISKHRWYVGFSVSLVGCANVGPVTPLMKIEATLSDNSNLSAELWPTH